MNGRSSMALLEEIAATALEPGYRERAEARAAGEPGRHSPGRRRRARSRVALVLVLVLIAFAVAVTLAAVRRDAPEAAQARARLADRVQERTATTDALASQVRALREDVSAARDAELASTRRGRERAQRLTQLEAVTGASAVSGPGIVVTVDDAPTRAGSDGDTADLGRVQDRDLQLVVNGLWAAGAEAVAVNGYRLTSRSAIRTAGEAVLVDLRPVTPPYRVEAIGDPSRLEAAFVDGPGGRALSTLNATYGIRFTVESASRLTVPAAASLAGTNEGENR